MTVTLNELFEAKAHIGHLARYWDPKMRPFIFGKHNGMHQIDLGQTQIYLQKALEFLRELGSKRGSKVLFVGTKQIAKKTIEEHAKRVQMPYVNNYWRGGNLTNYHKTSKSGAVLKNMQAQRQSDQFGSNMTKKEIRRFERDTERLSKGVEGMKDMIGLPDALFVVDVGAEATAVREARKLRIPIIGIVDTNHSPDNIDYVIPGNDDAIASVALYTKLAADAIAEGRRSVADLHAEEAIPQPVIKRLKKGESRQENN